MFLFKIHLFPCLYLAVFVGIVEGHEFLWLQVELFRYGSVSVTGGGHYIVKTAGSAHGMAADEHTVYIGGHLFRILSSRTVVGVEGIPLDYRYEPGGIVGVGGIATFTQPLSPPLVIGHVKVEETEIAGAPEEEGMVAETLLRGVVDSEALVGLIVVAQHGLTIPFLMTLYTEMVVTLGGEGASPGGTLQESLRERDGGRDAVLRLMLHGQGAITVDIFLVGIQAHDGACRKKQEQEGRDSQQDIIHQFYRYGLFRVQN